MINDKKCSTCRRAGEKLFLKGEKCFTPKCIFVKKPYTPGRIDADRKHRSTVTEYGLQLKEKQKVRNIYGVSEKQFRNYIIAVTEKKGISPTEALYEALERRLDNIVFRMGLAKSRSHARQFVAHGHILVNGRRLNVPSHTVRLGDVISVREGSKTSPAFVEAFKKLSDKNVPTWITLNSEMSEAKIKSKPKGEQLPFNLTSVIEFYSR